MPLVDVPFPQSSLPGQRPGEGQGRLINAYCEMDAGVPTWRPVPGLKVVRDLGIGTPRGFLEVGNTLYCAVEDKVVTVTSSGLVTVLTGDLPGTDLVTWARNNAAPTPDILVSCEQGVYYIDGTDVAVFVDGDLPSPLNLTYLDGYILAQIGDGKVYSTGLNDTDFGSLSFATCQSSPDGLLRGTASGQLFYGWGTATTEVWQNVGNTPFPLARVAVIPVGLIAPNAVAGYESGWDRGQIFVAADATVRRLTGYDPQVISTKDVERAIASVADKDTLEACVYVAAGHPIWSLSSPGWTWEYNAATGFWHERASLFQERWRARTSLRFGADWVVGDTLSTNLLKVDETSFLEVTEPLPMIIESGPAKQFPLRMTVPNAFFDWTVGQGDLIGPEDATDPTVLISWSDDGGGSWSEPLSRRLGREGEFGNQVRVNRCGMTRHHGRRWRLLSSSPVYRTLRGGRMTAEPRGAA